MENWKWVEKVIRNSYRYSLFWRQRMIFLIIVRTIVGHCWQHFYDYWICSFDWTGRHWQTIAINGKTMWINKQMIGDELIYAASFVACLSRTMTQIDNFLFFPHVYENWKETQTKSHDDQLCECASMIHQKKTQNNEKKKSIKQKKNADFVIVEILSKQFCVCIRTYLHLHNWFEYSQICRPRISNRNREKEWPRKIYYYIYTDTHYINNNNSE